MNADAPFDALAALRAYRLPDPVGWWPPAPGWWLLAALMLVASTWLGWYWLQRRRRTAAARRAREELARLRHQFAVTHDDTTFIRNLSKLLRRYALVVFPRQQVAALTGDDWLAFLDRHGGRGRFADGPGRHLVDAPYRASTDVPMDTLASLVEDWIRRNGEVRT